jgi:ureidoacrylate peracid hydrolase
MPKTCSSFFTGTHIDRILRYIGIENVIIVGFVTEQCVSTTARDACDHGYYVYVVSDACATSTKEKHEYELDFISNLYAKILTTKEMTSRLEAL